MGRPVGLYQLSVQQDIAPAPDGSPEVVDWLPRFAGFSWLAYGTQCAVVITMAPSPSNTGEAAVGGFFRQVVSLDEGCADDKDQGHLRRVCWAPIGVSLGTVAAAAGKHVHVYEPKCFGDGGNEGSPEIPFTWVKCQVLEHAFDILSFSWSESGDGLVSVGSEIVMWHKEKGCWSQLWRSQLEQPQGLSAASWSARGIAASADAVCSTMAEKQEGDVDHMVRIWWWWEDGKELQEIELLHPHHIVSIKWRPMRGFGGSITAFRPVLLTCCRDGVVRLWAEIGDLGLVESLQTSRTSSEPAVESDDAGAYESQLKLAFFVSAVIDVNSALKGDLGKNVYVIWPEAGEEALKSSQSGRDESNFHGNRGSEEARNEWLIGIGPSGTIALWSVQSLDDLSPARGPLIQLWHLRPSLLPVPSLGVPNSETSAGLQGERSVGAFKIVIHRPHGLVWGPPSSLDIFEISSPHLLRWHCVWPPAEAIGGPNSRSSIPNRGPSSTRRRSAWGVSTEVFDLNGHRRNIVHLAVHPSANVMLVASLDDHGNIIFWDSSDSFYNPRLESTGSVNSQWRICGHLHDEQLNCTVLFNSMAWAPLVLRGEDAILLTGSSERVKCFLISKTFNLSRGKPRSFSISNHLLQVFDWPQSVGGHGPTGIYTLPSHVHCSSNSQIRSCIVVGVGDSEQKLVSWKLDIDVVRESGKMQDDDGADGKNERNGDELGIKESGQSDGADVSHAENTGEMDPHSTKTSVTLLDFVELKTWQQVTCISLNSSARMGESQGFCDVVTGCADGVVRMWTLSHVVPSKSANSTEGCTGWHCVGVLKVGSGPVVEVAFCGAALKLASVAQSQHDEKIIVNIWGINILLEQVGLCLEARIEVAPGPFVSLSWFDGGIGLPVLGVASQADVQLFSESREAKPDLIGNVSSGSKRRTVWSALASSSPRKGVRTGILSWDLQGTLIVTNGRHILLYNDCVALKSSSSKKVQSLPGGSIRPKSYFEDQNGTRSSAERNPKADSLLGDGNQTGLSSILGAAETIGSPLLDYHPSSLMSWMCAGRREYARASIRHLGSCLMSLSNFFGVENRRGDSTHNARSVEPKVPRTPLHKIFQAKEQVKSSGQNVSWSLLPEENTQSNYGDRIGLSSSSISSFMDSSNDVTRGQSSEINSIKEGALGICTRVEVEAIIDAVKDSAKIPGLSELEKSQLLAVIDVLAEMDGVTQASQVDSIDLPGQRMWLAIRYAHHLGKWKGEQKPDKEIPAVESKVVAWALQSNSKETLCSLCVPDQSMTWPTMRAFGLGFWLTDGTELRTKMEKLARAQFLQRRDPKDCALLYIALDRRHVLSGLFKLSKDPKDKPLADFMLRDFKNEKHQGAALKNAYVLMGQHRHELAAAFFILGGDTNSAAVVCAKNMGDVQLALVICSLLEGMNGPIRRDIIVDYGLPNARGAGDVWLASLFQWLLGEGIQCIEELDCSNLIQTSSRDQSSTVDALGRAPLFPLDPDVGTYCALLASKPRLRMDGAAAARASDMARIAASQSAAALIKSGLHLQALDYVGNAKQISFSTDRENENNLLSTLGGLSSRSGGASYTECTDLEVGSGWISVDTVAGLHSKLRLNLAIRYSSQLLQDHPQWGGRTSSAWQDPAMTAFISKYKGLPGEGQHSSREMSEGDSKNSLDHKDFLGEADDSYANDVKLLQAKYFLKVDDIVMPAITLSQAHGRPYLCCRTAQGLWSYMDTPDGSFHLASASSVSQLLAKFLEISGIVTPRALARTVLSRGSGANASAPQEGRNSRNTPGSDTKADNITSQSENQLSVLVEELVRFGGEIQRLAKAASCKSPLFSKEKGLRAMNLLSFVFFVAAAWLGRQIEALHALVSSTVMDPSSSPTLPPEDCDAVLWFRRLDLVKASVSTSASIARGKRPVDGSDINIAGTVTISTDDAWRVLGVSLWTHLLIYVKKQLSGTASEALYDSLGRMPSSQSSAIMKNFPSKGSSFLGFEAASLSSTWLDFKSKIRESYQHTYHSVPESSSSQSVEGGLSKSKLSAENLMLASATDVDDFGVALLSAITSIVAGLRKQLATHLKNTSELSGTDQLNLWLWGKPSPISAQTPTSGGVGVLNFFGASSSTEPGRTPVASGASFPSRGQAVAYPLVRIGSQNPFWRELWDVLVVREKVCSALGLEGVNGQRMETQSGNMSGWYLGRKARALTPQSSLDRSSFTVNANGKPPPKRIMWETAEDMQSGSDQGVILSSKRDENMPARPRTTKEVHLSEEFSEWGCMACADKPSDALWISLQSDGRSRNF